jgi:hypothetical protein
VKPMTAFILTASVVIVVGTVIALMLPGWAGVATGVTSLWVFAAGLLLFGRLMRATGGRGNWFERVLRPAASKGYRPADLEHLERVLGWGAYSGPDFDHQVRPLLSGLIRHRLLDRHGIDLDADTSRAAAVAGDELVALVNDRTTKVMRTADIQRLVEKIETL